MSKVVRDFHKLWHESTKDTWQQMRWLGVKALKTPTDFWVYQELIYKISPSWIIETGTCYGGSALFLATILDAIGHGRVITIDINKPRHAFKHRRIEFYQGNSVDHRTLTHVRTRIARSPGPVMVILDSNHKRNHVAKELMLYSPLVRKGSYLIVEDTDINRYVRLNHGPGPYEAVKDFLKKNNRFVVDKGCERYFLTFHPDGYLKCVR